MTQTADVQNWTVEDVVAYLEKVGLGHKANVIKEKKMDGSTLLDEKQLEAAGFSGLQIRKIKQSLPPGTSNPPPGSSSAVANGSSDSSADLRKEIEALKAQIRSLSLQQQQPPKGAVVIKGQPVAQARGPPVSPNPHKRMNIPDFCSGGAVIEGNETQLLTVTMGTNDVIKAEPGSMVHMSSFVEMTAKATGQGFGRMVTGQSFFLAEFSYRGPPGTGDTICFTPDFPGQIIPVNLSQFSGHIICQKGSLLCCAPSVHEKVEFTQRLGAGFFGGEGFLLLGLVGWGYAFLNARGAITQLRLAPNERRIVATGCLVAFEKSVQYRVKPMSGLTNILFGGEGLFVTEMIGPGTIWVESHDMSRLFRMMHSGK